MVIFYINLSRKSKHTFYVQKYFLEYCAVYYMKWKKKIWYSQTGHRWQYGAWASHSES